MGHPDNKVGVLATLEGDMSQKFIKKVEADVNSRTSEHNKIIARFIFNFKRNGNKELGEFVLSDGSNKEDLVSMVNEFLPKIDESNPLGQVHEDESVARRKRSIGDIIRKIFSGISMVFGVLNWAVMSVISILFRFLILYPLMLPSF